MSKLGTVKVLKDHRLITIAKLEDKSYCLAVENPQSSGRAVVSNMRLTEESLFGLISLSLIYFEHNNIDLNEKLKDFLNPDTVDYEYSKSDQ